MSSKTSNQSCGCNWKWNSPQPCRGFVFTLNPSSMINEWLYTNATKPKPSLNNCIVRIWLFCTNLLEWNFLTCQFMMYMLLLLKHKIVLYVLSSFPTLVEKGVLLTWPVLNNVVHDVSKTTLRVQMIDLTHIWHKMW